MATMKRQAIVKRRIRRLFLRVTCAAFAAWVARRFETSYPAGSFKLELRTHSSTFTVAEIAKKFGRNRGSYYFCRHPLRFCEKISLFCDAAGGLGRNLGPLPSRCAFRSGFSNAPQSGRGPHGCRGGGLTELRIYQPPQSKKPFRKKFS